MRRSYRKCNLSTSSRVSAAASSNGQPIQDSSELLDLGSESGRKADITSKLWQCMKKTIQGHQFLGKKFTDYAELYDNLEVVLQAWHLKQEEDLQSQLEECQKQLQLEQTARAAAEARVQQLESQAQEPNGVQHGLQLLVKCLTAVLAESAAVSSNCKLMIKLYSAALQEAVGSEVIKTVEQLLLDLIVQDTDLQSIRDALQTGNGNLTQLWEETSSALTQLSQKDAVDASVRAVAELLASRKAGYHSTKYTQMSAAQAAFSTASNQSARDLDWLLDKEPHRVFDSGLTTLVNREKFKQVKQMVRTRSIEASEVRRLEKVAATVYRLHQEVDDLAKRVHRAGRDAQPSSSGRSPAGRGYGRPGDRQRSRSR